MKLYVYTESLNVSYRIYITTVTFIAFRFSTRFIVSLLDALY